MPRRPQVFVDGATYRFDCPYPHGARVFTAPEEAFELQVDALEAIGARSALVDKQVEK